MFETFIMRPIFNALMVIYGIIPGGDFGVAIILFTIFIRILIYPLVKKQMHQTKMMRKMQPELRKIKKASNGNRQLEAIQQMELYKKYGIKPLSSMVILFIQLPIFIALYQVIRVIIMNRDKIAHYIYEPVAQIPAIHSIIANPDSFNQKLLGFIDLTKTTFANGGVDIALLSLALISAVTQYYMSKQVSPNDDSVKTKKFRDIMREAAKGQEPDSADMSNVIAGNMMKIMPVMMFFIMIGLPGALALYYTISNVAATVQQHFLLKQDAEEMDEIASEVVSRSTKSSTKSAKERAKKANEAHITRIKAKD